MLILGSVSPFWRVKTKASHLSLMFFFYMLESAIQWLRASSSGSFSFFFTTSPQKVAEVSGNPLNFQGNQC